MYLKLLLNLELSETASKYHTNKTVYKTVNVAVASPLEGTSIIMSSGSLNNKNCF